MSAIRRQLFLASVLLRGIPAMGREWLAVPHHRRRQERDWKRLLERTPELSGHADRYDALDRVLRPAYEDYVRTTSSGWVAITYDLAVLLLDYCQRCQPRNILDLGSGFSTYVFSHYAREVGGVALRSVETDPFWRTRTETFLARHDLLSSVELSSAPGLEEAPPPDLVFLDLGDFEERPRLARQLVPAIQRGTTVILDDVHVRPYRAFLEELAAHEALEFLSLRRHSRQRLRFAAALLPAAARTP